MARVVDNGGAGGGGGGSTFPDPLLDWASSSETFGAGAGSYTIGGLSVTYDLAGGSAPDSIALSAGVLAVDCSGGGQAYLVIDLGEALTDEIAYLYATSTSYVADTTSGWILSLCDDTSIGNYGGHLQASVGHAGTETSIKFRECTDDSPLTFVDIGTETVTDVSTTPTRVCMMWHGASGSMSWDQGSAALPTDGEHLTNQVAADYNDGTGAATRAGRRYVHILVKTSVDIRLSAGALRAAS